MFGLRKTSNQEPSTYATRKDFCRIFEKDMNRLYLLSFLLTADDAIAEQCFAGGLHIAQEGNLVFKEWAESWARRMIVLNAIRIARPRLSSDRMAGALRRSAENAVSGPPEISAILELPAFERFAFVMSVLEGYSDHECSLHLYCTVGDVRAARARSLQRMGKSVEGRQKLVSIVSGGNSTEKNPRLEHQMEAVSGLAASA